MLRLKIMAAAGALAAALAMAGAAQAQIAPGSRAPLDIAADETEAFTKECRNVWKGEVEALQARTRLRASTLTAYSATKGDGCGEIQKLVAEGPVFYVTAERTVRASNAVYLATADTITLTGDVVVIQGRNVARAERVIIDMKTGESRMFAGTKGRGSANRVRGVFYPSGQPN
jgi:lipopolysaccharide export system protein LptA